MQDVGWVELAKPIARARIDGFRERLNPSLYEQESLHCDRSERNDPARAAARAGSPTGRIVTHRSREGLLFVARSPVGSSSRPEWLKEPRVRIHTRKGR